jgi:putative ABC transport system substrate-binding protein
MKRREFITLLGGATAWPLAARAQGALPVVGVLGGTTRDEWTPFLAALKFGLKDAGFIDRQNVEDRWADGRYERLPALAAELVRRRVAVIVWPIRWPTMRERANFWTFGRPKTSNASRKPKN